MHEYSSQEPAITQKAIENGISTDIIHSYFDEKLEEITITHPNHPAAWRLGRAEYLLWEHFCERLISYYPLVASSCSYKLIHKNHSS